ncbi:MAG: hypothetical protein AAF514_18010 [Verrucomicrobiota bacterium]
MKWFSIFLTTFAFLFCPAFFDQSVSAKNGDVIEIPEGEGTLATFALVESEVVVPIPSEVFNVLEKFSYSQADWKDQLQLPGDKSAKALPNVALHLGTVVAEGFLAVQAEDAAAVQKIGRSVLDLTQALGMQRAVLKHCNSILASADEGSWDDVREEFDATRQAVRTVMEERRDQDLAHCVSIGGWIRGTEIVTALIQKSYTEDKAELLHQPAIVDHFMNSIDGMDREIKTNKAVTTVATKLRSIQPIMSKETIPLATVKEIHDVCKSLRKETIVP